MPAPLSLHLPPLLPSVSPSLSLNSAPPKSQIKLNEAANEREDAERRREERGERRGEKREEEERREKKRREEEREEEKVDKETLVPARFLSSSPAKYGPLLLRCFSSSPPPPPEQTGRRTPGNPINKSHETSEKLDPLCAAPSCVAPRGGSGAWRTSTLRRVHATKKSTTLRDKKRAEREAPSDRRAAALRTRSVSYMRRLAVPFRGDLKGKRGDVGGEIKHIHSCASKRRRKEKKNAERERSPTQDLRSSSITPDQVPSCSLRCYLME